MIEKTGKTAFVCFAAALVSGIAFADGGTLTRQSIPGEGEVLDWWAARAWSSSKQKASMRIPGATAETGVYVVDMSGDPPLRFYVTEQEPVRILLDANGDGTFQAQEIHESTNEFIFFDRENFDLPYPVRDSIESIKVSLYAFAHDDSCGVGIYSVNEWYRGRVSVAGNEYEACLFFRFPLPDPKKVNEVVILDTDGDGIFQPVLDQWGAAEGIARFDERLWLASTVFSGSTAEFSLEPYSGSVGRLTFTGEGVHRLHLWLMPDGSPGIPLDKAVPLCLPSGAGSEYEIPPGHWRVDEVWLLPQKDSSVLYHAEPSSSAEIRGVTADLTAGGTASMPVGGPLTDKVSPSAGGLNRNVLLNYERCTNPAGLSFNAVVASGTHAGFMSPDRGPPYEVHTAGGRLIAAGNFEYG